MKRLILGGSIFLIAFANTWVFSSNGGHFLWHQKPGIQMALIAMGLVLGTCWSLMREKSKSHQ